ncbi:hypothetical protein L2E82_51992 [Cichorium intybus]|nr:hypothetical protein L2E82_51992 [Cichorium intybus]
MFESANNENKSDDLDSPLCISIGEQIDFFSMYYLVQKTKLSCSSSLADPSKRNYSSISDIYAGGEDEYAISEQTWIFDL